MALPPGDVIAAEPPAAEEIQAVPVRHYGRWVATVVVAAIAVFSIYLSRIVARTARLVISGQGLAPD